MIDYLYTITLIDDFLFDLFFLLCLQLYVIRSLHDEGCAGGKGREDKKKTDCNNESEEIRFKKVDKRSRSRNLYFIFNYEKKFKKFPIINI